MWVSKIEQRYVKAVANRIHQGDILTDLSFYFATTDYQADPTSIRYAVVMSQDCDLEQDYFSREKAKTPPAHSSNQAAAKHDKYLPTVLVCPAYSFESFTQGQHLNDWQMRKFVSKDDLSDLKRIKKNDQFKRYHYFESDDILKVPELIIDFKHFYTLPTELVYQQFLKNGYIATVNELFRESLSQRFASYLSRFGLPEFGSMPNPEGMSIEPPVVSQTRAQ